MKDIFGYYSLALLLIVGLGHIGSKDTPGRRLINFLALVPVAAYVVLTLFGPRT